MRPLERREYRLVPGTHYGTPKELWGFRTAARATSRAREFLRANAVLLGLEPDLAGIARQRVVESLGATHVIFRQAHLGKRIHRAYVTVHVDGRGRVYLAKNRAMPKGLLPATRHAPVRAREAARRARRALPRRGRAAKVVGTEEMWFPVEERLVPCWRIRIERRGPPEEWIVYVNARTGGILSRYDNVAFARGGTGSRGRRARRTGRALVFDPSPVTALGGHNDLITLSGRAWRERRPPREVYREVRLAGLGASGFLDGKRVTTKPTRGRVRGRGGDFRFASHEAGFEETMVYYHVDRAVRYLEELGFRGRRAIFRTPIEADARGTRDDNSWYSPHSRRLTFGTGSIDDAEDAETILHELGHALQDAIVPDFGQSTEAAAMGEGFGDYFAASFFYDRKPPRYRDVVMTWDGLPIGLDEGANPPALRRLDSKRTYRDFRERGHEHDNGLIWSATLWEIRRSLGRRITDTIVVESHFQLDGFTTFARGARAILDADEHLYRGRHAARLRRIFARRGIEFRGERAPRG
ncbi:MAG: M4 family metallopeptidase [Candidatus Latescibacteria bacterium]|nr:M4 family metallopeptidase [Candidatus Latescibacterota bacterium]